MLFLHYGYFMIILIPDTITRMAKRRFSHFALIRPSNKAPITPPAAAGMESSRRARLSAIPPLTKYTAEDTTVAGSITPSAEAYQSLFSIFEMEVKLCFFESLGRARIRIIPPPAPSNPFVKPAASPNAKNGVKYAGRHLKTPFTTVTLSFPDSKIEPIRENLNFYLQFFGYSDII